jgi:putative ABC transport system ATP-binding protein
MEMTTADDVLIRLDGVTKVFYTDEVETHALGGIHLEIQPGEYLSIAGPSGCGKSTLRLDENNEKKELMVIFI